MSRFRTLRARLALAVGSLLAITIVVFGAFVYFSLAQGLFSARDTTLTLSAAQAIAAVNIENGVVNLQDSIPTEEAAAALQGRGLTIRILALDGRVIEAYGPDAGFPVSPAALSLSDPTNGLFETTVATGANADRVRWYTLPLLDNGQRVGLVQVGQTLGDIEDTLQRLLVLMLIGGPLLIIGGVLGSYALVSRALQPVDRITRTAADIADSGDLSARLELPPSTQEVDQLAQTFDRMLGRIEASFERERRFTADASHELRTPLAAMQAILNVVRTQQRSAEDYERALGDIAEEADRLRALVEGLLSLARTDSPQTAEREPVDLTALIEDVVDSLRPLADAKHLNLSCDIPPEMTVQGDRDALVRVFVNVLDNAIQYTASGGVQIGARRAGSRYAVDIKDTGIGIPPEHFEHVFERFFRVERARSSRGAGLGLALARAIVESHGGVIQVESQMGRGSMFTIVLPATPKIA